MNDKLSPPRPSIPGWHARAWLVVGQATDAASGFGGPDVAEASGTAQQIGAALTTFLDTLEDEEVAAAHHAGPFAVRVEIEPCAHAADSQDPAAGDRPAEHPIALWEASAAVGNARGIFDGCYSFGNSKGDEGHLLGTASELGAELARVLAQLTPDDVQTMRYGTSRFFIHLDVALPH